MSCFRCYFCLFSTTDSGAGKCETSAVPGGPEVLHFPCVSWRHSSTRNASSAGTHSSRFLRCFLGVFPCDFGVSSVLFGFRVLDLVPCFRFGLVASPSPLSGFCVRPVLAVCFCFLFSCRALASCIFSL